MIVLENGSDDGALGYIYIIYIYIDERVIDDTNIDISDCQR